MIFQYKNFDWAADFDKCEDEHDLRDKGRAASARIKELEAEVENYRGQLVEIHALVGIVIEAPRK